MIFVSELILKFIHKASHKTKLWDLSLKEILESIYEDRSTLHIAVRGKRFLVLWFIKLNIRGCLTLQHLCCKIM